jgi:ABC-type multidrug transport system ATPase subunit
MLKRLNESSLVLTTHRMDEAESLCDHIVIMINGRFVCYGSPGHLKQLYGQGYIIKMNHVNDMNVGNFVPTIQGFMNYLEYDSFIQTDEVEVISGFQILESTFKMKSSPGSLNTALSQLCQLQNNGSIRDFQISRSSLETVFI